MRVVLFMLFLHTVLFSFGQQKEWSHASLQQLDQEQFKRLETGKGDPLEIAQIIIEQSQVKPSIYLINAFTVAGIVNKNRGYYVSALSYNLKALSVAETLKDKGRISACLNNIGILYVLQENYTKAIDYFNRSLKIEEELNQPLQKSIRLFNLGDCYSALNQFDEALSFYTSSLLLEKKNKNEIGVVYAQLGLAEVYVKTKRFSDATSLFADLESKEMDQEAEVIFTKLKGQAALEQKQTTAAIDILKQAEQLAKKYQFKSELLENYLFLSEAYQLSGDDHLANRYLLQYIELNKQLQSNLVKNQLEDLTYQNALQQKQMEIKFLKEQKELAEKNAQAMKDLRKFDWRIAIFSLVAMFALITVVIIGVKRLVSPKV